MYELYINTELMPVTPKSVQVKYKNNNKTVNLINDGEINIVKSAGLKTVEFELLLPNSIYPFANYRTGFQPAQYYENILKELKNKGQPFQFILTKNKPNGSNIGNVNITVVIEELSFTDDKDNGFDVIANVTLKEWKNYGTKTFTVNASTGQSYSSTPRYEEPAQEQNTYTVQSGDCLWAIAAQMYGDGSRYAEILKANSDKISNPDLIYEGQVLIIP